MASDLTPAHDLTVRRWAHREASESAPHASESLSSGAIPAMSPRRACLPHNEGRLALLRQ